MLMRCGMVVVSLLVAGCSIGPSAEARLTGRETLSIEDADQRERLPANPDARDMRPSFGELGFVRAARPKTPANAERVRADLSPDERSSLYQAETEAQLAHDERLAKRVTRSICAGC